MLKKIFSWIAVISAFAIVMILLMYMSVMIDENEFNKAIDNKPSDYYIEEITEMYLMSTDLYVYCLLEDEGDYLIYAIKDLAADAWYKVSYKIVKHYNMAFPIYKWEYNSHIYIGKDFMEET